MMHRTLWALGFIAALSAPTSASAGSYAGPHAELVSMLLSRSGSWRCPEGSKGDVGQMPKIEPTCIRDSYVGVAVLYSWAAECHAREQKNDQAKQEAQQAFDQAQQALNMCASFKMGGGGGSKCATESILRCGDKVQ